MASPRSKAAGKTLDKKAPLWRVMGLLSRFGGRGNSRKAVKYCAVLHLATEELKLIYDKKWFLFLRNIAKSGSCFCEVSQKVVALFVMFIYNVTRGDADEALCDRKPSRMEKLQESKTSDNQRRKTGRENMADA